MRRGLGRGRALIAIGAITTIVAMPLPWLKVGGIVLSAQTANGFDSAGILAFVASVGMLALIVLPYTTQTGRFALDRTPAYAALVLVAAAGMVISVVDLLGTEGSALAPLDVPGIWLAGFGTLLAGWGVLELIAERPAAP